MYVYGKLLWLVLLSSLQSLALGRLFACTCSHSHPQDDFCRSKFVLKIYMRGAINGSTPAGRIFLSSLVEKIYKGDPTELKIRNGMLILVKNPSCGIAMNSGKRYLVFGMESQSGRLRVSDCPNQIWGNTRSYRSRLENQWFKAGCDCWKHDPMLFSDSCKRKHSYLNNNCKWVKTEAYINCKIRRFIYKKIF